MGFLGATSPWSGLTLSTIGRVVGWRSTGVVDGSDCEVGVTLVGPKFVINRCLS